MIYTRSPIRIITSLQFRLKQHAKWAGKYNACMICLEKRWHIQTILKSFTHFCILLIYLLEYFTDLHCRKVPTRLLQCLLCPGFVILVIVIRLHAWCRFDIIAAMTNLGWIHKHNVDINSPIVASLSSYMTQIMLVNNNLWARRCELASLGRQHRLRGIKLSMPLAWMMLTHRIAWYQRRLGSTEITLSPWCLASHRLLGGGRIVVLIKSRLNPGNVSAFRYIFQRRSPWFKSQRISWIHLATGVWRCIRGATGHCRPYRCTIGMNGIVEAGAWGRPVATGRWRDR